VQDRAGFQTELAGAFLRHTVAAEIIFGGISELQQRSVGSLTFALTGSPSDIDAALAALRGNGIDLIEEDA